MKDNTENQIEIFRSEDDFIKEHIYFISVWRHFSHTIGFYSTLYPYIYIYIYIYTYTNFVEHNRHFLSTYFLVDPFVLPHCFYRFQRELIDVFSIIVHNPGTFCPTLGHHQGRISCKSDATFVFALLLCKSVFTVGVYSVCF